MSEPTLIEKITGISNVDRVRIENNIKKEVLDDITFLRYLLNEISDRYTFSKEQYADLSNEDKYLFHLIDKDLGMLYYYLRIMYERHSETEIE